MTNLSRRSFFRLVAGAALVPIVATISAAPEFMLWGDAVHYDDDAIAALLRGDIVEFSDFVDATGAGWKGKTLLFPHGRYRMSGPLTFDGDILASGNSGLMIDLNNSVFFHDHDGSAILIKYMEQSTIKNSEHLGLGSAQSRGIAYI